MIGPCISIFYQDIKNIVEKLEVIPKDIALEIRLDRVRPGITIEIPRKQLNGRVLILTVRTQSEGGYNNWGEEEILRLYSRMIDLYPDYIDIGIEVDKHGEILDIAKEKKVKTICSYHNPIETPELKELIEIYRYIESLNPDIIKIVTYAKEVEDNDKIVKLMIYMWGKKPITAFCMGPRGRISRIYNLLLMGAVTYLALDRETAEGQLTLDEYLKLKEVYKYV